MHRLARGLSLRTCLLALVFIACAREPEHPPWQCNDNFALVDCSLPLEPWDGKVVTLAANVSCDQDDVLGPAQDDAMFTTRGFQVDEPGSYLLLASQPEGWSGFRIVKCGSCWDAFDVQIEPGAMETHELTPGRCGPAMSLVHAFGETGLRRVTLIAGWHEGSDQMIASAPGLPRPSELSGLD